MRVAGQRPWAKIGIEPLEGRRLMASQPIVLAAVAQVTSMPAQATTMPAGIAASSNPSAMTLAAESGSSDGTTADEPLTSSVAALRTHAAFRVGGTTFTLQVTGAGQVLARKGRGGVAVTLIGTDGGSALTVAQSRATHASRGAAFVLSKLAVRSKSIGSINAGAAILNGPTSGLKATIATVSLGSIGPKGTLQADNVRSLSMSL